MSRKEYPCSRMKRQGMVGLELSNFGDTFQAPASYHISAYTAKHSLLVIAQSIVSVSLSHKCVQSAGLIL